MSVLSFVLRFCERQAIAIKEAPTSVIKAYFWSELKEYLFLIEKEDAFKAKDGKMATD